MKTFLCLLAMLSCSLPAIAQTKPVLYVRLSKVLDSLARANQHVQKSNAGDDSPDRSTACVLAEQKAICARHQQVLREVVKKYGFPGFEEVGEKSSTYFVQLVQHADANPNFQRRVLRLMAAHLRQKNASPHTYAYFAHQVAQHAGRSNAPSTARR
jgi:hypothetical protein